MKKRTFTILLISIFMLFGIMEPFGQIQFQMTVGSTQYEYANTIIQTADGGYVLSGSIQQVTGYYNMYIVKLSPTGTLQWTRTIGEANQEHGNVIIQTTDGGYMVAGGTASFGAGDYDMYIVKLDFSGGVQWAKTIGGSSIDEACSIVQTTDGGYIAAGSTISFGAGGYDVYIVKLAASGTLQWSRTIGGSSFDEAYSIVQATDGGYVFAGETTSFGATGGDMYIVKLDASGTPQWSRTIGGSTSEDAFSIIQAADGGLVITGITNSFGAGGFDTYIVKLNSSGMLQWSKTIGGTGDDYGYSVKQTIEGGYIMAGFTYSFGATSGDMYIVKLDNSGIPQWSKTIGGSSFDEAFSIIQTTDGGYAAGGYAFGPANGNMYIVKFDSAGNTCGNGTNPASLSGTSGTANLQASIVTNPTSSVTSPVPSTSTSGTVTTICITAIQPLSNLIPSSFELYQNYPNPFNPMTKLKFQMPKSGIAVLTVYDALGKVVQVLVNQELSAGTYEVDFDGSNLTSGVYYYRLNTGDYYTAKKMILLR
jgi:hypothetical protein